MAFSFSLLVPNAVAGTTMTAGRSGNSYVADAYGVLKLVTPQDAVDLQAGGALNLGFSQGRNNLAATTDPTTASDNTQDYAVGSVWVNTSNGRVWIAQAVSTAAAAWALAVVPGTGIEPSSNLEQFGSGTGTVLSEGNLYRAQYLAAGAISPGATGADNVLAVYSIPANSFDVAGRGISITASGSFAANGNTKECKIIFNPSTAVVGSTVGTGGTTIADTGASSGNNVGWALYANVFKVGANGSNTQYAQETGTVVGATHGGMGVPVYPTATESGAILVAVTGNATTTATDIKLNFVEINAMN